MKRLFKCSFCKGLTKVIYSGGNDRYICKNCLLNNINNDSAELEDLKKYEK